LKYITPVIRHLIVIFSYKNSGIVYFLRTLGKVPMFKCETLFDRSEKYNKKQIMQKKGVSIGHAFMSKIIRLTVFNKNLLSVHLEKKAEITADQFFLNRSVADVKFMMKIFANYIHCTQDTLRFDPGCGAERHLFYLADRYNCSAIGVDVYEPAIKVANSANFNRAVDFYNLSTLDNGVVDKLIPEGCDFVFINSWLNHVYKYPGYSKMIGKIIDKCRFVMIINSKKYQIKDLIPQGDVVIHKVYNDTQYVLLKGNIS